MRKTKNYKHLIGLTKPAWQRFYEKTFSQEEAKISNDVKKLLHKNYFKSYVRLPITYLEKPSGDETIVENLLLRRESHNQFTKKPLSITELSRLLYYSAGINQNKKEKRFYPSAGAIYPLEVYIIALNVDKLKKGIYHYYVKEHGLEYLSDVSINDVHNAFQFPWVVKSGAIVIITAVFNRTMMKYGNRGYNYIYIEAGHLCQNILLLVEKSKLGASPVGGFYEEKVNKLLDVDPQFESSIYTVVLGNI